MSAHVLMIILNKLGKRDKMRGLPSILSLFRNELNKFNNTHVLLNLSNELGKRDKQRGLSSILSLFLNEFNKFNNARAQM